MSTRQTKKTITRGASKDKFLSLESTDGRVKYIKTTGLCWEVTKSMRMLLRKTQSFRLKKFPVSFWNYTNLGEHGAHMTEAEVESWADAGFTVLQSPGFDPNDNAQKDHIIKLLNWADKLGMKLILCDPRCYAKKGKDGKPPVDYADGIRSALADFGNHPALFGFHVGDEPNAKFKNTFFECYRIQKEIAPHLHPFANLAPCWDPAAASLSYVGTDTWPNYLDEFVKKSNADLVGYDCYAQMASGDGDKGWNIYYRNLRLYREAALRNGIPFWNTILSVGHYQFRCPSQDEIRWQFNTSIAAGANGIVWFFYYMRQPHGNFRMSPVDEHWDKTQTYYDIRRVQKSFHRRYGDLFNRLVSTRVSFLFRTYGEGEMFKPDDLLKNIEDALTHITLMLIGEFMDIEGKRYVMFVNNSMAENGLFRITFQKNVKTFSWDWNGKEYEGGAYCNEGIGSDSEGNPVHSLWLAPGQEAVYRVEIRK